LSDIPCGGIGVKEMDAESQRSVDEVDAASWRRRIYSFFWYSICQSIDNTQTLEETLDFIRGWRRRIYSFVWRRRIYSFGGGFIHLSGGGGFIHLEEDLCMCLAEEDSFIWRRIYACVWRRRIHSFVWYTSDDNKAVR
jgi:hypothetical protein